MWEDYYYWNPDIEHLSNCSSSFLDNDEQKKYDKSVSLRVPVGFAPPKENSMPAEEICSICTKVVKVQIMKGSGVCSELCRKKRDGETDEVRAQTDAGITALLKQPEGVNLRGIT